MGKIDKLRLPKHIAIIMDGNGRWARKKHLPKIAGHKAGVKSIEETIKAAKKLGIPVLTLYAFSTENWKRPKREVDALMRLLEDYLDRETEKLAKKDIRLKAIGRISAFPPAVQQKLQRAEEKTSENKTLVNLALNYGGRAEIIDACKKICEKARRGALRIESLSEAEFSNYLYTAGLPDPDLLIRTSGEMRISNFLLWQSTYSEIYITKKFWPDFRKEDLEDAIIEYQRRERRYGG